MLKSSKFSGIGRIMTAAAFVASFTGAATYETPSYAADAPTVRVASDPSFKPFAFMDTTSGRMEGFDVDVMQAAAKIAGYRVEIVPVDFAGIIPALQSKNVDAGASSITITPARKTVVDFTAPYYDSGLQLLVQQSNNSVTSIEGLKGKTIAALTGSTGYNFVTQQLGSAATVVPYPSYAAAFLALQSGSADAVIGDQPVLTYYSGNAGKGKAKVVGPLYQGEQFGFAFQKNSKWVGPTSAALETLKKNGTYAAIYKKWFNSEPPSSSR